MGCRPEVKVGDFEGGGHGAAGCGRGAAGGYELERFPPPPPRLRRASTLQNRWGPVMYEVKFYFEAASILGPHTLQDPTGTVVYGRFVGQSWGSAPGASQPQRPEPPPPRIDHEHRTHHTPGESSAPPRHVLPRDFVLTLHFPTRLRELRKSHPLSSCMSSLSPVDGSGRARPVRSQRLGQRIQRNKPFLIQTRVGPFQSPLPTLVLLTRS